MTLPLWTPSSTTKLNFMIGSRRWGEHGPLRPHYKEHSEGHATEKKLKPNEIGKRNLPFSYGAPMRKNLLNASGGFNKNAQFFVDARSMTLPNVAGGLAQAASDVSLSVNEHAGQVGASAPHLLALRAH